MNKDIPSFEGIISSGMKKYESRLSELKKVFFEHTDCNSIREHLERHENEKKIMKKYGCKGLIEMCDYISKLEFAISKIHHEVGLKRLAKTLRK